MTEFYFRPDGMPPVNGYSHAVAFAGRTVVVSGQLPLDRDGKLAGPDAETQLRQVFDNLSLALTAAGASLAQVVKLTVYLTDLADLPAFRQVRDEYISPGNAPASSLVQVAGLVHPEARVEIEALASTLSGDGDVRHSADWGPDRPRTRVPQHACAQPSLQRSVVM